jgi:hypothetical protein
MAADLLARVRTEIDGRLAELRPALAEYERLLDAAAALEAEAALEADAARPARASSAPAARPRPRPRRRGSAARATGPAASASPSPAEEAIVAALEHGSHTVGELGLVTAIPGRDIRQALRGLQRAGTITPARREGRIAYALASAAAD